MFLPVLSGKHSYIDSSLPRARALLRIPRFTCNDATLPWVRPASLSDHSLPLTSNKELASCSVHGIHSLLTTATRATCETEA